MYLVGSVERRALVHFILIIFDEYGCEYELLDLLPNDVKESDVKALRSNECYIIFIAIWTYISDPFDKRAYLQ